MATTTRRMMIDVLIGLAPVLVAAVAVFRWYAVKQVVVCLAGCLLAEAIFNAMRRRATSLGDFSATVTGMILAFSLPPSAPWYVGAVGSFAAIGLGKCAFGGLGQNIFNPAMVGRAFVMICFASAMGASAYVIPGAGLDVVTQATPLTAAKSAAGAGPDWSALWPLFVGNVNGSVGETSALACLLGGLYLCFRRAAKWEIPLAMLLTVAVIGGLGDWLGPRHPLSALHHLAGGAVMLGAFFIATDPVSSPVTSRGRWIFGAGVGALVMLMRAYSGYPEGVMFSVLLMNALTPLINRSTIPRPLGGSLGAKRTESIKTSP
jgi:electron transport complex protein RnfD